LFAKIGVRAEIKQSIMLHFIPRYPGRTRLSIWIDESQQTHKYTFEDNYIHKNLIFFAKHY